MRPPTYKGKPIPKDWRDTLQVGDVLLTPSRDMRVVRHVTYNKNGYLRAVNLAIRQCSWTGRAYTCYFRTDLETLGFHKAGVRARLTSEMDKKLEHDLMYENRFKQDQYLTCIDARCLA